MIQNNVAKKLTQINAIQKDDYVCRDMAFDSTGSLLIWGCNQNIKVWEFKKGILIEKATLIGHKANINCFVFSKKLRWFVSGSQDTSLRCWKEIGDEWISSKEQIQHRREIICLLLCDDEKQLFSGGGDWEIIVWKVDQNEIQLDYKLERRHKQEVKSLSINESETTLVSLGDDKNIILWMKGKNQQWEYVSQIETIRGQRLAFVSDTQFFYQAWQDKTSVFQIHNKSIIEQENLAINLKNNDMDNYLFPIIVNKKRQLMIVKHSTYVYFIQKQFDDSFKMVFQPIFTDLQINCGTLSEDGQYFVTKVDDGTDISIVIYEISY